MSDKNTAAAVELLEEIQRLMELKGENPFKIRAFSRAIEVVGQQDDLKERAKSGTLTDLPGIGKGISEVLTEFFLKGTSTMRDDLESSLPEGLLELTKVPGLGPKKAIQLIEELGITSITELEYACRENRLLKLKGFGDKVQKKILEGVVFLLANADQARLVDALPVAEQLLELFREGTKSRVSETGALRRRMETLASLDYLIELPKASDKKAFESKLEKFRAKNPKILPVNLHFASPERFGYELARMTGTEAHWKALGSPAPFEAPDEEAFFAKMKIPFLPPETRETGEEVELARAGKLDTILPWEGIQGVFHNHTVRSDGSATLEEMVIAAKRLGYRYIGISDHSQTAFYAQGLKKDVLKEQEKEVRSVQEKHPEIRVFWGIESDILQDGSLDYEDSVLKKFDFVVASIHSRFKADREAMTDRILAAIRNPYTRFLGHATGRLLLGRPGYDCDMEKIIREAAKHDVAIEINANPARLDIDWRWGPQLRKSKTPVSVNPDAHDTAGLEHTHFGISVARKALLPTSLVINSRSVGEVEKWLKRA